MEPAPRSRSPETVAHEPKATAPATRLGLRFALKYALLAGVAFVAYGFPYAENGWVERAFELYLGAYALVVGGVLEVFEPGIQVVGTQLIGGFPLEIAKNCESIQRTMPAAKPHPLVAAGARGVAAAAPELAVVPTVARWAIQGRNQRWTRVPMRPAAERAP